MVRQIDDPSGNLAAAWLGPWPCRAQSLDAPPATSPTLPLGRDDQVVNGKPETDDLAHLSFRMPVLPALEGFLEARPIKPTGPA
jgi:hypothetical protein